MTSSPTPKATPSPPRTTARGRVVALLRVVLVGLVAAVLVAFAFARTPFEQPKGPALIGTGAAAPVEPGPLSLEGPVSIDGPGGTTLSSQTGALYDVESGDLTLLGPAALARPDTRSGQ